MNLLEKHKGNYKKLKKKELIKIIEEQYELEEQRLNKIEANKKMDVNRNNNRRAFKKFFPQRHTNLVARAKVKEKLAILKDIRDKGE